MVGPVPVALDADRAAEGDRRGLERAGRLGVGRLDVAGALDPDRDDRCARAQGETGGPGVALVQHSVAGAGALGVDAEELASLEHPRAASRARSAALPPPRSIGIIPIAGNRCFVFQSSMYSALPTKVMRRGRTTGRKNESITDVWFGQMIGGSVARDVFQPGHVDAPEEPERRQHDGPRDRIQPPVLTVPRGGGVAVHDADSQPRWGRPQLAVKTSVGSSSPRRTTASPRAQLGLQPGPPGPPRRSPAGGQGRPWPTRSDGRLRSPAGRSRCTRNGPRCRRCRRRRSRWPRRCRRSGRRLSARRAGRPAGAGPTAMPGLRGRVARSAPRRRRALRRPRTC